MLFMATVQAQRRLTSFGSGMIANAKKTKDIANRHSQNLFDL